MTEQEDTIGYESLSVVMQPDNNGNLSFVPGESIDIGS